MKKNTVITFIFALPILVNCQSLEYSEKADQKIKSSFFDGKIKPDSRGIISYDKYQVVVANGNETVLEIANRLNLDPREFSMFNGLVESYRPRLGELLALNQNIVPAKKLTEKCLVSKKHKKRFRESKENKTSLCYNRMVMPSIRLKLEKRFIQ
ncbi:MAG: hypothetical protein CM15mP98_07510 [Paracoccaceae bacterium]|nr:MAG: hypothetical protein CM15mP98_07510 [Paracoccaceae bacterium]